MDGALTALPTLTKKQAITLCKDHFTTSVSTNELAPRLMPRHRQTTIITAIPIILFIILHAPSAIDFSTVLIMRGVAEFIT